MQIHLHKHVAALLFPQQYIRARGDWALVHAFIEQPRLQPTQQAAAAASSLTATAERSAP
jgi:hypothetical protein